MFGNPLVWTRNTWFFPPIVVVCAVAQREWNTIQRYKSAKNHACKKMHCLSPRIYINVHINIVETSTWPLHWLSTCAQWDHNVLPPEDIKSSEWHTLSKTLSFLMCVIDYLIDFDRTERDVWTCIASTTDVFKLKRVLCTIIHQLTSSGNTMQNPN